MKDFLKQMYFYLCTINMYLFIIFLFINYQSCKWICSYKKRESRFLYDKVLLSMVSAHTTLVTEEPKLSVKKKGISSGYFLYSCILVVYMYLRFLNHNALWKLWMATLGFFALPNESQYMLSILWQANLSPSYVQFF